MKFFLVQLFDYESIKPLKVFKKKKDAINFSDGIRKNHLDTTKTFRPLMYKGHRWIDVEIIPIDFIE